MMNRLLVAVGIVVVVLGAFWALQGFGAIGGSFMSNNHTFEVVGPVVALVGLVLVVVGMRRGRSSAA